MAQPDIWTREGPYVLEWADVGAFLERLADELRCSGFRPTVVHAVARGGLLAAAYLATVLDVPRQTSVRVRRTTSEDQYASKQAPMVDGPRPTDLRADDRVLVVDDIVGTGDTARAVRDQLVGIGVARHRFAALVRNHRCSFPVDHCAFVADDWVVFPWERAWSDRPPGWRPVSERAEVRP